MTNPTDSATCPTCGSDDPKVYGVACRKGASLQPDPFHTPTHAPTDEVREALDRAAREGLECARIFENMERKLGVEYGPDALRDIRFIKQQLLMAWEQQDTLEAALSRDTEHDRLMREVVEAARDYAAYDSKLFLTTRNPEEGDWFKRDMKKAHKRLAAALDRLTDYEGSNNG